MRRHAQQQQGHMALFTLPIQNSPPELCRAVLSDEKNLEGVQAQKIQWHWYQFDCLWHGSHDSLAIDHFIVVPASPLIVDCACRRRDGRRKRLEKYLGPAR